MPPNSWAPNKQQILREKFGFSHFREGQEEIIDALLAGQNVMAVMPTGGGKSLCYQLPALLRPGITLVISPLIALMKDQVDGLKQRHIPATFINSSLSWEERLRRQREMEQGCYRLVYVAPERLQVGSFSRSLARLAVASLVIDEAHCISQWGHDFRPDYLRIKEALQWLGHPQISAFTATATPEVQQDIIEHLQMQAPTVFVRGFNRENLYLQVKTVSGREEKLAHIRTVLQEWSGTGIIYTATQKNAQKIYQALHRDYNIGMYHGGLPTEQRTQIQDAFKKGQLQAIVATNAFGMGVDKPDIRYIIHYDIPGSLEAYYQEIGRAGRDGEPALCLLLFNHADIYIQQYFIDNANPSPRVIESVYHALWRYGGPVINLSYKTLAQWGGANEGEIFSVLKILEQGGYLQRVMHSQAQAGIRLRCSRQQALTRLGDSDPARLLSLMTDLFQEEIEYELEISLSELRSYTGMLEESLHAMLVRLRQQGVIDYRPAINGQGIILNGEGPANLELDWDFLRVKKARDQAKLQQMVRYAYHRGCRREVLLSYFGEKWERPHCTSCDNCHRQQRTRSMPAMSCAQKIPYLKALDCIASLQGRFGRSTVAKVLKGSRAARIRNNGLTTHESHGVLSYMTLASINRLLDQLLAAGCCKIVGLDYPKLHLTSYGQEVLQDQKPLHLLADNILRSQPSDSPATSKSQVNAGGTHSPSTAQSIRVLSSSDTNSGARAKCVGALRFPPTEHHQPPAAGVRTSQEDNGNDPAVIPTSGLALLPDTSAPLPCASASQEDISTASAAIPPSELALLPDASTQAPGTETVAACVSCPAAPDPLTPQNIPLDNHCLARGDNYYADRTRVPAALPKSSRKKRVILDGTITIKHRHGGGNHEERSSVIQEAPAEYQHDIAAANSNSQQLVAPVNEQVTQTAQGLLDKPLTSLDTLAEVRGSSSCCARAPVCSRPKITILSDRPKIRILDERSSQRQQFIDASSSGQAPVCDFAPNSNEINGQFRQEQHSSEHFEQEKSRSGLNPQQQRLYAKLRALRRRLAGAAPAFTVTHNGVLEEMARRHPLTPAELQTIEGIDAKFMTRYGDRFLAVLRCSATDQEDGSPEETHLPSNLYQKLSELRAHLAGQQPAHTIIATEILEEIAARCPLSRQALLAIKGVDRCFLNRYGDLFLELIRLEMEK